MPVRLLSDVLVREDEQEYGEQIDDEDEDDARITFTKAGRPKIMKRRVAGVVFAPPSINW